jgi:hypothetical protein
LVKRDVELKTISGVDEVVRLGPAAIKTHAVLAEELPHVTDGEPSFEEVLQFFRTFGGPDGDVLNHRYQITGRTDEVKGIVW